MSDLLTQFSLENYRAYLDSTNIQIRPLTLFYGYNSTGKSAALRFLQLAADSTRGVSNEPLNLCSNALRGAPFSSLVSKFSDSNTINVGFQFSDFSAVFSVRDMGNENRQIVEKLAIQKAGTDRTLIYTWEDWGESSEKEAKYKVTHKIGNATITGRSTNIFIGFDGLLPIIRSGENEDSDLNYLKNCLERFSSNFFWISANRSLPARWELLTGIAKRISPTGEGITSMLQIAPQIVIDNISDWYQSATGYSFKRNNILIGDKLGCRYSLHPNGDPKIDIDIVDTGEGMGQVLPIIGLLTLASNGDLGSSPTLAFEHPELHIHPDAHAHLANKFCDTVTSNHSPRVLIETHSENFLLGVQLAIIQGKISPDDVIVHWVKDAPTGAEIQSVEFDDNARPKGNTWPVNVFQETAKLARTLFDARRDG